MSKIKITIILFCVLQFIYSGVILSYQYVGYRYSSGSFPSFYANSTGTPDCSGEFTALQNAITTWNNVNTTYISFSYGGTTGTSTKGYDGTNLLGWIESGWRTVFSGSYAIAVNSTWISSGVAYESDIMFNGEDYQWSDNGQAGKYDVQNIATHEIGHSVGLGDLYGGGDTDKTMYGYGATGETKKSTLDSDDVEGARYVNFEAQTSGTLSESQTWMVSMNGSSVTLSGNVTVPSGITLTVTSSLSINFNGYGLLLNGGSINFEGGTPSNLILLKQGGTLKGYFASIQSAINYASSGQTIELQATSYSESISFSSKSNIMLQGQGISNTILNNNVSITNSSYIDIVDVQFNYPVTINSSSETEIMNCSSYASEMVNDYSGTNSTVSYCSNNVATTSFGFSSYGGTGAIYESEITDHDLAVYLTSNASYSVGNHYYFCNNLVDISATNGGFGYAISNTYSYEGSTSGNVTVTGTNYICGSLAKAGGYTAFYEDNSFNDFKNANEKYLWLLRMISEDKRNDKYDLNKYLNYFGELIKEYKDLLKEAKEMSDVKNSLSKLSHLYKALNQTGDFDGFINSLLFSEKDESLKPFIERYKVWNFVDNKNPDASIELINKILSSTNDIDLTAEMKYEKGLVNKYYLKNEAGANKAFAELIQNQPEHLLSKFAINEITESYSEINSRIKIADEGYSITSHPNPFNPTTQISYSIPERGLVSVKIFDILGSSVAELVNEIKDAGKHSVSFDGSKLSSGVYIYTIKANNPLTGKSFTASKKMILAK